MKNLLFIFTLLFVFNGYSQKQIKDVTEVIKIESKSEKSKLSLSTKSILLQAKLEKKNSLTNVNLNSLLRITLLFENNCSNFNDGNIFSHISKITENISTAFVKIEDLPLLENIKCLKYADIGEKIELEVNNARIETNTNSVHLGAGLNQSYSGTGVIVGIIDVGFDYTHPNFKDSQGNLRISRVWERTNSSGNPPTNFGLPYGSEYVGSTAILDKMGDIPNQSHGTHVAGIASGFGSGNPELLRGMSPNSEIVLVSGFNPVNTNDNNYIDAIKYLKEYAASVNKPIVINMSFSFPIGPHDGSTIEEIAIDSFSNNPGLVMVAGAGNDGGSKKHALNIFDGNQTKFLLNTKNKYDSFNPKVPSIIEIWSDNQGVNSSFEFSIGVFNTSSESYESELIIGKVNGEFMGEFRLTDKDSDNNQIWDIKLKMEINPVNNKPHLLIACHSDNDTDSDFLVVAITSIDNIVHSWCNNCEFNNPTGFNFTDGDDYFSISSPGTANGLITVGSYNVTDENLGPSGTLGGLSHFSSKGPRADNIIKPTITAPGNRIVSSLSSFDANYQTGGVSSSDVTNIFGNHTYGKMQGTSMAAPVVTGIIALWLEANPQLTTNEVLNIIANSAISDDSYVTETFNYYGTNYSSTPNVRWGYGKIDALEGIKLIESALSVENLNNQSKLKAYPNPFSNQLTIETYEPIHKIEIYNLLGQKVKNVTFDNLSNKKSIIDLSPLGFGNYFAKVFCFKNIYTIKLIKN